MNDRPDLPAEIRGLLDAYCNDAIDDERLRLLESRLLADAAARREFVAYFQLETELHFAVRARLATDSVLGRIPDPPRRRAHGAWAPYAAAAAVLLLVAGALWAWGWSRHGASRVAWATYGPRPPSSYRNDRRIALVSRLDAARWEASQRPQPAERTVLGAGRYQLAAGRATLSFFSGVTLTMEGPADVELDASDRIFCHRGRLRARIPKGAEGFLIAAPGSAVIDLGTELAINVEDDGTARVMVFEGQAEAALLDEAGSAKRTQMIGRSEAFELDPRAGRIAGAAPRPDAFVSSIDSGTVPLVLAPSYPGAVLASRPRGYWRFEALVGGAIPNEVPGGPPLRIHGPVALAGDAGPRRNGYASFKPGAPDQFLDSEGLWKLPGAPGHAVELWFLAEHFNYATLVGLVPPEDRIPRDAYWKWPHNFLLEVTGGERQSLYRPASIRFLHRWPLDLRGGDNICSEAFYVPRRWHHVVAQKRGARMELYFDGAEQSLPLKPDHPDASCRLVVARRMTDPKEPTHIRPFIGRLDELALYDHPLSAEEIRRHFRLAGP